MLYPQLTISSNNPMETSNDKHKDCQNQRRPFPWLSTLPSGGISDRRPPCRPGAWQKGTLLAPRQQSVSLALLAVLDTCRFGNCGCPGRWPRDPRNWGGSVTEPRGRERGQPLEPSGQELSPAGFSVCLAGEEEMGIKGKKKHPTRYLSSHGKAF